MCKKSYLLEEKREHNKLTNSLVSINVGTRDGNKTEIFRNNRMHMRLSLGTLRESCTLIWTVKQPNCAKVTHL